MCYWHLVHYEDCGHEEIQRVPYSCDVYTRHRFGTCRYSERHDGPRARASLTYAPGYCSRRECEMLYKYINYT